MNRHISFLRHGESTYNILGLCNDDPTVIVPLTDRGRSQVENTVARLMAKPIDLIFASAMPRAIETATIANSHHNAPLRIDSRLNDRRTGFEGRRIADYLAARDVAPDDFFAEGGESYKLLKARTLSFLDDLEKMTEQHILVVSHHEVLQVIYGYFHGLDDTKTRSFWLDNAAIFEVELPATRSNN